MIPYLKELGVTIVELMPVLQQDPQEGSSWGYMPLSFFGVHEVLSSREGAEAVCAEFRSMITAFHRADIEVILDMVLNHSGGRRTTGEELFLLTPAVKWHASISRRDEFMHTQCGNNNRTTRMMRPSGWIGAI